MNNDAVFTWILSHPSSYPGKCQKSQARTFEAVKPLDPKAQFHVIIKALGSYIRENMEASKGVNLRGFGAFSFDIKTNLIKPMQQFKFNITNELDNERLERKHNH